jgi:uncharacterized membrane protein
MKQNRLESLADGIFAIVMTILVFEIKLPMELAFSNNYEFMQSMMSLLPFIGSYVLSFAFLFTFWKGHSSVISSYAKNIDARLLSINALFLLLITLVPLTEHLFVLHYHLSGAVIIFSLHIMAIGLVLLWMRLYTKKAKTIENIPVSREEETRAYIRILFPVFCAMFAGIISLFDTSIAVGFLTVALLFNLSTHSSKMMYDFFELVTGRDITPEEGERK